MPFVIDADGHDLVARGSIADITVSAERSDISCSPGAPAEQHTDSYFLIRHPRLIPDSFSR